jgi:hypothetical protein
MLKRILRKYATGRDTFIRHRCVAELLKRYGAKAVLDIGGEGRLNSFVKGITILSANISSARDVDYKVDAGKLPFANESFDMAVSLDTLEHISLQKRKEFVGEMLRVSAKGIIICAPLGTPEHVAYERDMLKKGGISEEDAKYLEEHIDNGLPTPEEISSLAQSNKIYLLYQGDFRDKGYPFKLWYFNVAWNLWHNIGTSISWNSERHLISEYNQFTNRFFFVALK